MAEPPQANKRARAAAPGVELLSRPEPTRSPGEDCLTRAETPWY